MEQRMRDFGAAERSGHRRRSVLRYTLLSALAYHVPVAAAYLAKFFGLARYEYDAVNAVYLAIIANCGAFLVSALLIPNFTKRTVSGMLVGQVVTWFLIVTMFFYVVDDLRVLVLLASLVALTFVFIQANFLVSFLASTLLTADYLAVAWFGVTYMGQGGQLGKEVLYVIVFLPVSYFVAYQAGLLREQHRGIRAAERARLLHEEQAHAQEIALESLKKADRLKDEFLANISHELRTPLNAIIGFSAILRKRAADQLDARSAHFLDSIHSAGERLLLIINDILDISMLAHGELQLELVPTDAHTVTSAVIERLSPLAAAKSIELVNGVERDLPKVLADEGRLLQILTKLVDNGIKFSESGKVEVTAWVARNPIQQETGSSEPQQALAITVSDQGIGISTGALDEIFHSFEQEDGSWSRRFGGTGLGLAITHKLVELHGGTVSVESEVGAGSCFVFTLPLA